MDPNIPATASHYAAWQFWFSVGTYAATVGVGIYVWFSNRQKATSKAVADLGKHVAQQVNDIDKQINGRVDRNEDRITRVEVTMEHLPTHKDISKISTRIEAMHGEISRMSGSLVGLNRAVDLMNEHLLVTSSRNRTNEFRDKELRNKEC
jgi:hypothetical protein